MGLDIILLKCQTIWSCHLEFITEYDVCTILYPQELNITGGRMLLV